MENKICTQCNIDKQIKKFYKKYSECKDCNIKRDVKRYYDNKDKISMQQKIFYEKKIEIDFHRNKTIIEIKEGQNIQKCINAMLNHKVQ